MKKIFIKSTLIIFSIVLSFYFSFKHARAKELPFGVQTMAGAIIDKHSRLKSLPSPKLITIGGSNAMFGFDSEYMERRLKIPVQNMALGASLGLTFMLNEVREDLKKDDIVLLSLEYYLDEGDENIKLFLVELYPQSEKYVEYKNNYERFKINCNYVFRELRNYLLFSLLSTDKIHNDEVYGREAFNKNGNIKEELRLKAKLALNDVKILGKKDYAESIAKINMFIKYAKSKQAKVFFVFPPLAEIQYKENFEAIEDIYIQYQKKLEAQILNKPTDSVYPDSCFYDTIYHLRSPYHTTHAIKVMKNLEKYWSIKQQPTIGNVNSMSYPNLQIASNVKLKGNNIINSIIKNVEEVRPLKLPSIKKCKIFPSIIKLPSSQVQVSASASKSPNN